MKKFLMMGILSVFLLTGCSADKKGETVKVLTLEEAKEKSEDFISNNLVSPGTKFEINEIVEEDGLYKINISIADQEVDSYISKDGKKFYPQIIDIEEVEEEMAEANEATADENRAVAEAPKSGKPKVELFVMSHCPYGTQIEKGILPVIENLGDSIDFELKFCTYAMHGKKELDEQLRQYCIQQQGEDKILAYLGCFLEADEPEKCMQQVGLNKSTIDSCIAKADKEFKVTEKYNDESTWTNGRFPVFDVFKDDNTQYGVQGSPTLVINGKKVSSQRSPSALLSTICSAFDNAPDACGVELSTATPSAGFGYGTGAASAGSCN